jgi:hypothetical protein
MGRKGDGNRDGENVLCPLFVAYSENELRCQSHVPDAAAIILRYADTKACKNQRRIFCEGCWERCEHWQAWKHFRWEDEDE